MSVLASPGPANPSPSPRTHSRQHSSSSAHADISSSTNGTTASSGSSSNEIAWGANFWVTLVDPQTNVSFYACPSTGQVSWDPPVGNFVLPPSAEGEWWELSDDSRGGIPYYYHTKTGDTVWERPNGFVIPLGILQNTAMGRRLSMNMLGATVSGTYAPADRTSKASLSVDPARRSRSFTAPGEVEPTPKASSHHLRSPSGQSQYSASSHGHARPHDAHPAMRRSQSDHPLHLHYKRSHGPSPSWTHGQPLDPIPGSPDPSEAEASSPPTPSASGPNMIGKGKPKLRPRERSSERGRDRAGFSVDTDRPPTASSFAASPASASSPNRARSRSHSYLPRASPKNTQSLHAAAALLSVNPTPELPSRHSTSAAPTNGKARAYSALPPMPTTPTSAHRSRSNTGIPGPPPMMLPVQGSKRTGPAPSPRRPIPAVPAGGLGTGSWARRNGSSTALQISGPVLDLEATMNMSPIKNRATGRPIHVPYQPSTRSDESGANTSASLRPILPDDLVSDIQQFIESDFARNYFATHRTGFIFRRTVPVAQMMTWQKTPLSSPLLVMNRALHKDAVKVFRVIQRIMGDRSRARMPSSAGQAVNTVASDEPPATSASSAGLLEEERWLLGEGLTHGELRDEIYCQLMKQLSGNPNTESVFKGWQLLCVLLITFPPSKNFETYLRSFMLQRTAQTEGRADVMAKYCLRRLAFISKKGPRGKPPTVAEIETASDAAFNPSTFGESLDAVFRLQQRNYPHEKVPIVLPFLADGILALGGSKAEGIFRVPGDGDAVSELRLRIDRGYYTLDGVDDPHVLASLLKLWLRELLDPLVPEELYNDCVARAADPGACIDIVERLPTINRRVVLFIISFLQLFLDDRVQTATKMTPINLALVMAPNVLRCSSESMSVVFTNAQYEQNFVYNLLIHLKCGEIDPDYRPAHGLRARTSTQQGRASRSRQRKSTS